MNFREFIRSMPSASAAEVVKAALIARVHGVTAKRVNNLRSSDRYFASGRGRAPGSLRRGFAAMRQSVAASISSAGGKRGHETGRKGGLAGRTRNVTGGTTMLENTIKQLSEKLVDSIFDAIRSRSFSELLLEDKAPNFRFSDAKMDWAVAGQTAFIPGVGFATPEPAPKPRRRRRPRKNSLASLSVTTTATKRPIRVAPKPVKDDAKSTKSTRSNVPTLEPNLAAILALIPTDAPKRTDNVAKSVRTSAATVKALLADEIALGHVKLEKIDAKHWGYRKIL